MDDILRIKELLSKNYGISAEEVKKIKNVYKIKTNENEYCLKVISYDYGHFLFILSAIQHLINNKFKSIPEIAKTLDKKQYIKLENKYAYLTDWINSRECNYDNPLELIAAVAALANLHIKSRGLEITEDMNPRIGWFKWIEQFKTRKNEILDFKSRIGKKDKKTEFDCNYLKMMEEELIRAENSINNIISSEYLVKMNEEIAFKGFCHHDYAHHNILINSKAEINVIDFDYCILDTHLHDLSSMLIRKMKNGKWDIKTVLFMFDVYNSIYKIENTDIPIMAAFMEFPQEYWQVGIQYYWEKQPWGEEFFLNKLKKIEEDRDEKQEFIEELRILKYRH